MTETPLPVPRHKRLIIISLLLLIAVIIGALLALHSCNPAVVPSPPVAAQLPFDYFRAKAEELHNDPTRIMAFVRDTMPTLDYRGNVKGALGALWNGAASVDEKKLLAEALLAAAKAPRTVTLDEVGPKRDKAEDNLPPLKLTILYRIETAAQPHDTPIYDGPAGDLVGDVHSVEVLTGGQRRITLRSGNITPANLTAPDDAIGEDLIFTWQLPDSAAHAVPVSTTRELWHRGNRTGAGVANPGDRHDFVVIPCRIGPYVRKKETLILQQRGREKSPEASAYLGLLDYAMESDQKLADIEKRHHITACFDAPRILILSRLVAPDLPGGTAYAIDLRNNSVGFTGDPRAAYRATQERSFLESSLEQQFLPEFSGLPASSAFDVFSMLKDEQPANGGRRLAQIRTALRLLQMHRAAENSITFSVRHGSRPTGSPLPTVQATWSPDGIEIHSGPLKEVADRLAEYKDAIWLPAAGVAKFKDVDDATIAVETGLLAADVIPPISPGYSLNTNINLTAMSLVQPQARFTLQWSQDNVQTEQQNRLLRVDDGLTYQWRIQTGVLPVAGTRQISSTALQDAATHNPWYRAGNSVQTDATSFVFSHKVYEAIKSGGSIDLAMQTHYPPKADFTAPRPLDFSDKLSLAGVDSMTPMVNGRPEKLTFLRATLHGQPMAILDDAASPIGMADAIRSVVTVARGQLLDENNKPISGAHIRVLIKDMPEDQIPESLEPTAADGVFALPPSDPTDDYGKVMLQVIFNDKSQQNVAVDFTARGLSIVPIHVPRPHTKLLYLMRDDKRQLDALNLSDSLKRQALRQLDAGRMVVIPNKYVNDGWHDFIAFYACDPATGEYVGITEDGLCGSTNWEQPPPASSDAIPQPLPQTQPESATQTQPNTQPQIQPAEEVTPSDVDKTPRILLNAAKLFHVFQSFPSNKISRTEATLQTLQIMQGWADGTDIAGSFGTLTDQQIDNKLGDILKARAINAVTAKWEIQLGYVSTTHELTARLEAHDEH